MRRASTITRPGALWGWWRDRSAKRGFAWPAPSGFLELTGTRIDEAGAVAGFAPPGDVHRVRNSGVELGISLHIYGTDINRIGNSIRRTYDLPVHYAR